MYLKRNGFWGVTGDLFGGFVWWRLLSFSRAAGELVSAVHDALASTLCSDVASSNHRSPRAILVSVKDTFGAF